MASHPVGHAGASHSYQNRAQRSGLQFACDELIDKGAIHTGA